MKQKRAATMTGLRRAALLLLASFVFATPALAGDYYGPRPLRYGVTSPWWTFDARNDNRDFPTNGGFPGNFAANPPLASIGAAGFLESNPYRSPRPYPSQVYFGPPTDHTYCARHYRSYDPVSGTYLGKDGMRHRC
ncbi:BA14K family protein [Bradyrhizobium sp. ARR65]|uniref:BA14K family protein n=1 Tax=Bradyrhizobium sp. ARR65 TaxID=1040989 RepID=UPI000685ABA3|nr:BA14K family protein [Bradyrhizobium sp. ARR65]